MVDVVEEYPFSFQHGAPGVVVQLVAEHQPAPVAFSRHRGPQRLAVGTDLLVVEGGEVDAVLGRTQDLQRAQAAVDSLRRAAHVDLGFTELEHRPGVDHHGHASGDFHLRAVAQRGLEQVISDLVGLVVLQRGRVGRVVVLEVVAHDPHDVARLGGGKRLGDRAVGVGRRAVGGGAGGRLVDEDRVGQRLDVEPEVVHAAGNPVGIAVEHRARGIDHVFDDVGYEVHAEVVNSLRGPAHAAVLDLRIVIDVSGAGHAKVIRAGLQIDLEIRVFAVIIVVSRDDPPLGDQLTGLALYLVLLEQRQCAVQLTHRFTPLGNRLGAEQAGRLQRELVKVDVVAVGPVHVLAVDDVVIAGIDSLAAPHAVRGVVRAAHNRLRRHVVGVPETQRVRNLVHRRGEPCAAVRARTPGHRIAHDRHRVAGNPRHQSPGKRVHGAHVAGDHGDARIGRLDGLHAQVVTQQLEDLAGTILLRLGNQVMQHVALRVEAVFVLEVVFDRAGAGQFVPGGGCPHHKSGQRGVLPGQVRPAPVVHIMVLGGHRREVRQLAVARLVHPAGPFQEVGPIVRRRHDAGPGNHPALPGGPGA